MSRLRYRSEAKAAPIRRMEGPMMRVALCFDRPYVDAHPCFREMAVQFARHGWAVDLLVERCATHPLPEFGSLRVTVSPFIKTHGGLMKVLSRLVVPFRYDLVVAIPQWTLYWAVWARRFGRYRVACLSDEIFLREEADTPSKRKWKERESAAHRAADLTVGVSEARMRMVTRENQLNGQPYVVIPNAPAGRAHRATGTYYRDRFSIPNERGILVHSGTMNWNLSPALARFASEWEHAWDVVFQGRFYGANGTRVPGSHVHYEDRVFPAEQMRTVTSSADIGVALYDRSHPLECRADGESSGKIGLYLSCGLPVICGNVDSLRWVEEEHCGAWVSKIEQIPAAAVRIRADYDRYCAAAVRIFNERFEYSAHFSKFLDKYAEISESSQRPSGEAHPQSRSPDATRVRP